MAADDDDDLPPDPLFQTLDTPRETPMPSKAATEEDKMTKQLPRKTL